MKPVFSESMYLNLLMEIDALTAKWEPDPVRSKLLVRLFDSDKTVLPYFRNLLCNIVYNSHGTERKEAQRILKELFGEEVEP